MRLLIPIFIVLLAITGCKEEDGIIRGDPPVLEIGSFKAEPDMIAPNDTTKISIELDFAYPQPFLEYTFTLIDGGRIEFENAEAQGAGASITVLHSEIYLTGIWIAPDTAGDYRLAVNVLEKSVSDQQVSDTLSIEVQK